MKMSELIRKLESIGIVANIDTDNNNQIIIYTNLMIEIETNNIKEIE